MPRRHRHGKRRRVSVDWLAEWLITGIEPDDGTPGFNPFTMIDPKAYARETWPALRASILAAFVKKNPGRRPWAWWVVDAPEPRQRMGGVGTPVSEGFMSFGLPTYWTLDRDSWRSGAGERVVPVDPKDPPTFEGQGAYLRRLNLLLPRETPRGETLMPEPADIEGLDDEDE